MAECKIDKNKSDCTCSYEPCSRKGLCCQCVAYHRKRNELPGCFFPQEIERTYNRSIQNYIRHQKG
ncbi:MAG: DUF6485 family protein [Syntrophomonadaceae bacterium]|nr:DUF6485 family protein [Syntrophomonadaceae bacterium]